MLRVFALIASFVLPGLARGDCACVRDNHVLPSEQCVDTDTVECTLADLGLLRDTIADLRRDLRVAQADTRAAEAERDASRLRVSALEAMPPPVFEPPGWSPATWLGIGATAGVAIAVLVLYVRSD